MMKKYFSTLSVNYVLNSSENALNTFKAKDI